MEKVRNGDEENGEENGGGVEGLHVLRFPEVQEKYNAGVNTPKEACNPGAASEPTEINVLDTTLFSSISVLIG
jgi:hypothetical protein